MRLVAGFSRDKRRRPLPADKGAWVAIWAPRATLFRAVKKVSLFFGFTVDGNLKGSIMRASCSCRTPSRRLK